MNFADIHDNLQKRRTEELFDDFDWYTSGQRWTSVNNGGSTIAVNSTGVGGLLQLLPTDSVLNRECYLRSTNSPFLIQSPFQLILEAFIQYTEANVNEANIGIGFMNSVANGAFQDNVGDPKTSFSGACLYKVPGGTKWKTCSSVGTTQNISQSDTVAGGASYTRLRIEINPVSSTLAEVTYFVDGIQLKTSGGRPGTSKIKDQLTFTGALAMQVFAGCKNGSTTAETLNVDYIAVEQLRATFT